MNPLELDKMSVMHRRHVISWVLAFLALVFMLMCFRVFDAHPSPLDCESVRDADHRNMCRAVSKHDKTYCEFIKEHDLRSRCRAAVK